MNLFASLSGLVTVELTGADLAGTLEAVAENGITMFHTKPVVDLTLRATIYRADLKKLKMLCRKRGDKLAICRRSGLYWTGKGLLARPVLLAGILFFLIAALMLPSRILFVRVEGNSEVPSRMILEKASACGIGFGASRRDVRSEQMKNALLEAVPQLQWAGVNTYGCVAVISVRERAVQEDNTVSSEFGHIIALRDGVITACTSTKGTMLCSPGQVVSEGEILISGYTDCGICIRAEQAEGEIYAQTRRSVDALSPGNCITVTQTGDQKKKFSLLIGKKRINLWKDSGIWDITCDRMYEEYYITLPGGFQLPVALAVERYIQRDTASEKISPDRVQRILTDFGASYLQQQMVAGKLETSDLSFREEDGWSRLTGKYVCIEMIAKMQRQKIGEYNGEDS